MKKTLKTTSLFSPSRLHGDEKAHVIVFFQVLKKRYRNFIFFISLNLNIYIYIWVAWNHAMNTYREECSS
jgi:hypothetical protein